MRCQRWSHMEVRLAVLNFTIRKYMTIVHFCQLDLYLWICQYQKWMILKGKFLGILTAGSAMAEYGGRQSVKRRSR